MDEQQLGEVVIERLFDGTLARAIGAFFQFATVCGLLFGMYLLRNYIGVTLVTVVNLVVGLVEYVKALASRRPPGPPPIQPATVLLILFALAGTSSAIEPPDDRLTLHIPKEIRVLYRNVTDSWGSGSCVFAAGGMCCSDQNAPAGSTMLWNTEYGNAERGGAGPSRMASVARKRGIPIYNVTGDTFPWMKWADRNWRPCAIGAASNHFQTLSGIDAVNDCWRVCNNNSPSRIDEYSTAAFKRLHAASGPWIVIYNYPPHPAVPEIVEWWN